jgi:hypothetical protein
VEAAGARLNNRILGTLVFDLVDASDDAEI